MTIYGKDCGCNAAPAPAPKAISINVTPAAPTESVVCPDARCLDYMLSSAPESEAATASILGMHKGRSYVVPVSVMLDAYLKQGLNNLYRGTAIPALVNYRDLEAVQVTQKSDCEKIAIAPLTVLSQAIAAATPKAPLGYVPATVQTYDKDGAPYLATPLEVVGPAFIDAAIENCPKMKNIPLITQLMGFGKDCADYGMTSIKQLSEALAASLKLAPTKQLPDGLRGFKAGVEGLYPVQLSRLTTKSASAPVSAGGPVAASGNVTIGAVVVTVPAGLWQITGDYFGGVNWQSAAGGYAFLQVVIRLNNSAGGVLTATKTPMYFAPGSADTSATGLGIGVTSSTTVFLPEGGTIYADATWYAREIAQKIGGSSDGQVRLVATQVSQTNFVMNEVI